MCPTKYQSQRKALFSITLSAPTWQKGDWQKGLDPCSSFGSLFPGGSDDKKKNPPATQETRVQYLDWDDPLEKEMATSSSILAWRIPWTEEPSRLVHGVTESDTTELLALSLSVSLKVPGTKVNPSFHLMRQLGFPLGHSSVSGTSPLLKPQCRRAAYGSKFPTWNSNQELSASSCPPPSKRKLLKLHFWYPE